MPNMKLTSVPIAIVLLLLTACGGSDEGTATPPVSSPEEGAEVLAFSLSEWAVTGPTSASAGTHRFEAVNDGTQAHELVIIRTDAAIDALPVDAGRVAESGLDVIGELEQFPAGESSAASFSLEPGRYVLICNIPGHYQLGMRTELVID